MEGGKDRQHRANKHRWMHQTTTLRSLLHSRKTSLHSPALSRHFLTSLQFCKPGQCPHHRPVGAVLVGDGLQLFLDTDFDKPKLNTQQGLLCNSKAQLCQ